MRVLGVDPGTTGAVSLVDTDASRLLATLDLPMVLLGGKKWLDGGVLLDVLDKLDIDRVLIEQPGTRGVRHGAGEGGAPTRSIGNEATLAAITGGLVATLLATGKPLDLVSPQIWKKRAGLIGCDKKASLKLARARLGNPPELAREKMDIGRAEAALVALYGADLSTRKAA